MRLGDKQLDCEGIDISAEKGKVNILSHKMRINEPQKGNKMDEPLDMNRLGKGEKDLKGVTVQVEIIDDEYCITLPDKFVKALNWKEGDTVEWSETELCYNWGETQGFVLRNLTKETADLIRKVL